MTHPTVSNEAVRAYLRDRKSGQYPDLPSASNLTPASKKIWSVFLDAAGEVVKNHYSENIIAKTLHGERKDALEIAASLDWFKVFQRLGSDITGDVGFWRWVTTNTPNFFEFVRWRDGSLDSWPKKEARAVQVRQAAVPCYRGRGGRLHDIFHLEGGYLL